MIEVLSLMTLGILLGYVIRQKKKITKRINHSTFWVVLLLLFFMGVSVGSNPKIMQNLQTIGLRGLELALSATFGSILLVWLVFSVLFKSGWPTKNPNSPIDKNTKSTLP
ncbi:MAG: lysine exporter LysO family protein [Salinivirgaceae bacterium]|nr:lysine exporter LysO family protein [Salinivirgaceae bacterium]